MNVDNRHDATHHKAQEVVHSLMPQPEAGVSPSCA